MGLTARRFRAVFATSAWQPLRLFGLSESLAFAQAHAGAAAVFVDEFDAGGFKCLPYNIRRVASSRLAYARFYLSNSHDANSALFSQILLAPSKEAARSPALCWASDH